VTASGDCYNNFVDSTDYFNGSTSTWVFESLGNTSDTYRITVSGGRYCYNTTLSVPSDCYDNSLILADRDDYGARTRFTVTAVDGRDGYFTITSHARHGCDNALSINRHFVELRRNQTGNPNQQWRLPGFPHEERNTTYEINSVYFETYNAKLANISRELIYVHYSDNVTYKEYDETDGVINEYWHFDNDSIPYYAPNTDIFVDSEAL